MRSALTRVVVVLALAGACASPGPFSLSWPTEQPRAAARGEWIGSWPQAMASIAEVFTSGLGLPPLRFTVHFFPGRRAFEEGLVEHGYAPEFARRTAGALDGIGGHRLVLLNEHAIAAASWPDRVAFMAHELVHVLQYELGGGRRGTSEQWLRDGFAEWVAGEVMAALHLAEPGLASRRARAVVTLAGAPRFPALSQMATFEQWVNLRTTQPALPTYEFALVASAFLVERHGMPAVLDYFARFAVSDDADGHFTAAFGESRSAFESALRAHLAGR